MYRMRLNDPLAIELYESIRDLPIIDYHTHLPAGEILGDHKFDNLWELWLKHDHYKWRLMRGCGVDERLITGDADAYEKFAAFAAILPMALGNPVYQWAHMELSTIFEITTLLNADTAKEIWDEANQQLTTSISVRGLLNQFNVELIGTTDDPYDDLNDHKALKDENSTVMVVPTYRPDKYLLSDDIDLSALKDRHDYFLSLIHI